MEGEDAKNNLFFVGINRFNYYIIEPLNELISVLNTGINNYYWNLTNLPIPSKYNYTQINKLYKTQYDVNFKTLNIKPIKIENINNQYILYLTFEKYNDDDTYKVPYEYDFVNNWVSPYDKNINNTNINNLIRLKSNIEINILVDRNNIQEPIYRPVNMDIVIPFAIFEDIFKTHSYINKSKLPITCYFAITPELTNEIDINKSKEFGNNFYQLLNNKKLNNIFMSDVKKSHEFVGYFLSALCLSEIKNNNDENNIITFFNHIYVLPCLHDIKDRAGTIYSYFDMKTDCRNNLTNDENVNDNKRKKDCTNIVIECGENKTIRYNIIWTIYNNFYADGYRDQNKNGRRLCRKSNFLGIFFENFVANEGRIEGEGGKKNRKTKRLRKNRKHKSRKHKSRKH